MSEPNEFCPLCEHAGKACLLHSVRNEKQFAAVAERLVETAKQKAMPMLVQATLANLSSNMINFVDEPTVVYCREKFQKLMEKEAFTTADLLKIASYAFCLSLSNFVPEQTTEQSEDDE